MDKLFGKYSLENIVIKDQSIAQTVSLTPVLVPHTFGRQTRRPSARRRSTWQNASRTSS